MQSYTFEKTKNPVQQQSSSAPLRSFRSGAIQVAIWENTNVGPNGQPMKFQTVTFERRYRDKEGKWQKTNSLRVNDLPKAALILQKAYEYLVLNGETEEF
jgi:hypothetical protein